jgi:hypothetical protein
LIVIAFYVDNDRSISLAHASMLQDILALREPASRASQQLKNTRKTTCG